MQDYDVIREIGSGSFGKVCKIRRKSDGKELACKEINYRNLTEKEKGQIVAEVNILKELQNPFIVRYYEHIIESRASRLHIVMELCSGGDLGKAIQKCQKDNSTIHEDVIWKIFAQVASALKECHRHMEGNTVKPILHRDIKPANIFLDSHNNIKIGDFGLAKELSSEKTNTQTNVGTPFYMSPELINGKAYDERSDIWSLGCLLYELACLKPPHHDARGTKDLVTKINSGRVRRIPSEYSSDLWKTIQDLMAVDLSKRPRIEDVLDIRVPAFVRHMAVVRNTTNEYNISITMEKKFKEKEDQLRVREQSVASKEKAVATKEAELQKKEQQLLVKEAQLKQMELDLKKDRDANNNNNNNNNNNAKITGSTNSSTAATHGHHLRKPPVQGSGVITAKPSAGGFQIYADPPSSAAGDATTGSSSSKNLPPPPPPPPLSTRTTEYMVAESAGGTGAGAGTGTGTRAAVTSSVASMAINTRRRSLARPDGDGSSTTAGTVAAPTGSTSTATSTTISSMKEVSDGVRRAKELLNQNGKHYQHQLAAAGGGKENAHATYVSLPIAPPPPPPVGASGIISSTATSAGTRKRTIGATISAAPINTANMANILLNNNSNNNNNNNGNKGKTVESPMKKMRPTTSGAPLQLRVAPPAPTNAAAHHAFQQKQMGHHYHQPKSAPSGGTGNNNNTNHAQLREATALL